MAVRRRAVAQGRKAAWPCGKAGWSGGAGGAAWWWRVTPGHEGVQAVSIRQNCTRRLSFRKHGGVEANIWDRSSRGSGSKGS